MDQANLPLPKNLEEEEKNLEYAFMVKMLGKSSEQFQAWEEIQKEEKEKELKEKDKVIKALRLKTRPKSLGFYRSRFNA